MFRRFGGSGAGELVDLPNAQLAVLRTTHVAIVEKVGWLDGRRVAGASSR